MPSDEFGIIRKYFIRRALKRADVILGSGDDCALLQVPPCNALAVSIDTLVAGVHFPSATLPEDIAYKAVAVNLSDLAAIGAEPAWMTCALTLPKADEAWLKHFAEGLFILLDQYKVALVGGDLTCGPLCVTLQAHGFVPPALALRRDAAKAHDLIYVTGTLGDAGAALRYLRGEISLTPAQADFVLHRLNRPQPRIEIGLALRGIAHAAIDTSDGLAGDLQHILTSSKVGATLWLEKLPFSEVLLNHLPQKAAWELALTAGDDYELCFTVPASQQTQLEKALAGIDCAYQCIGIIETAPGLRLQQAEGKLFQLSTSSYKHF